MTLDAQLPIDGIGMPAEAGLRFNNLRTRNPDGSVRHRHNGVDLYAPEGTPIRAVADGVVVKVVRSPRAKPARPARFNPNSPPRDMGGYGVFVDVQHADGRVTRNTHMQEGSVPASVARGARVRKGEMIGRVGTSRFTWEWRGGADGDWHFIRSFVRSNSHDHFEVITTYPPPREGGRMDPEAFFRENAVPFVRRRKAAQVTAAKRANPPTTRAA